MKVINMIVLILIVVGAINWGLWGFFQFDLVAYLFGGNTEWVSRVVYAIVGLAGVWSLSFFARCKAICGCCSTHDHQNKGGGCCR